MFKHIKDYNNFKLNELSEFNLQRSNSDSSIPGIAVDNPQLSTNAFDKAQDAIRQSMSRINDIMYSIKGTNAYKALRSKLSLEEQDIKSMKILRIIKSETLGYDIYITFVIGEEEYWGRLEDILGQNPEFTSEVFKDIDLYQPKEWVIKITGLITKTIKTWLKPEPGEYRLINDEITCYSIETGKLLNIKKGIEIEVVRSHNDKIIIRMDSETYNLVGDNYIYFNWWFESV